MHVLNVVFYMGGSQTFLYGKDETESAKKDFATLKTAMDEYRKFKNDTSETVTISGKLGDTVFRTEHLVSVNISDMEAGDAEQMEWAAYNGRLKGAHEAAARGSTLTPADGGGK